MPLDLEPVLDLEPIEEESERPIRYNDELIAALPDRERRRLDILSEMAASRPSPAEERRERLLNEFAIPAAEGALTALSLNPAAIARTFEKGIPATAAAVRGEETFTPAPPAVSGFLNPEIEGGTNALKIPYIPGGDSPLTQIPAGLGNAVIDLANIFTTPEGILTLGIGGLPKGAQRAVVGTMAANMAAHYPEEFNAAVEAAKAGDLEQATRRIVATPVMASVMARASMEPVNVPRAPEFPGLPDPDLVARNLAEPGTFRPQEQYGAPRIEPPTGMFEAGEVPFDQMQRFSGMRVGDVEVLPSTGPLPPMRIIDETRPKVQTETRGKVSFGAEAPTLLRTAIQGAEEVGLTKAAEAARKVQDAETVRGDQGQVLEEGRQPQGVQDASRQDLQQPSPKQAESLGAQGGQKSEILLSDVARENAISAEMKALIDAKRYDDPKLMELLGEMETLKNKYEGHKPSDVANDPLTQLQNLPGTSSTQEAMALGKKVSPASIPRLEAMAKSAADEANRVIAEVDAMPSPTTADLTRMSETANRAQLMNEAVEASRGGEPAILARDKVTTETATTQPDIVSKLEGMKFENVNEGKVFSLPHPDAIKAIGKQAWNDALDLAIGAVKAGRTIAEAVEMAWRHIQKLGGKADADQIRANLQYVVSEETKPAAPATSKPSAAKPSAATTLDDVYAIFETEPKPSPTVKERVVRASEAFRTGFSSSFRPLNKLSEDVAKQYGGTPKDVAGVFEQLKGSSGKAEADVYRFDQEVSKTVKGSEQQFNAYVFLRRAIDRLEQDAASGQSRRKVSGYTVPDLQSKLAKLEEELTPNQRAQFQTAADAFQRHMDQALKLQVDSGRMAPEVYQAIKEGNQFYAPFKVMKYLEDSGRPSGTGRRVDTAADYVKAMEGIESPDFKLGDMLAAARQNLSISRILAEKNRAMQNISDLAALDTEQMFVRKLKAGEEAARDMEAVNVFENGVQERYAVNPDVAAAIQIHGPQSGTLLARVAGNIFRIGATTANVPFQAANLMADVPRQALVSKYGVRGANDLVRYPLDYMEALYSSFTGNFGRRNKLYLDFLDSGAAGSTVQQFLTPEALRFNPEKSQAAGFAKSVINTIPEFANAIEQTSKIVGVKRAMRIHGVESGAQLARQIPEAVTEIRRFSGSPDFGRSGKWTDQARLNLLYMFFNARVQGAVADIGRLAGRDGAGMAGKTWFKLGTAVGLPTLYAYLINNSDQYREDYAKRPEQEKRNYWLIPKDTFITSSSGEKVRDYWRIPKREAAKWMGNFVEAGMDFARDREPERFAEWAGRTLEDVFPVNIEGDSATERLESVGASLNPIFKAPLEVATGRDMYRHKPIVPESMRKASPEQQYTDRTSQVFRQLAEAMPDVAPEVFRSPLMLENVTKNVTAGLITQFLPRQPVEGRGAIENFPLTQRFQAVPYADSTEFEERMEGLERESADEQLARFRNADKLIKEMRGQKLDTIVKRSMELHGPDRKQVEKVVELWMATQRGITPQERRVMALPTQQRAQFIISELEGKTAEEKAALLRQYSTKRILTEAVAEQMIQQGFNNAKVTQ